MAKTIKELAEEFNTNKTKIFRIIKNHNIETKQKGNTFYIDETNERLILKHLRKENVSNETQQKRNTETFYETIILDQQKQIDHLQKLLENQQVLTLKAQEQVQLLETKKEEFEMEIIKKNQKKKWKFWK